MVILFVLLIVFWVFWYVNINMFVSRIYKIVKKKGLVRFMIFEVYDCLVLLIWGLRWYGMGGYKKGSCLFYSN